MGLTWWLLNAPSSFHQNIQSYLFAITHWHWWKLRRGRWYRLWGKGEKCHMKVIPWRNLDWLGKSGTIIIKYPGIYPVQFHKKLNWIINVGVLSRYFLGRCVQNLPLCSGSEHTSILVLEILQLIIYLSIKSKEIMNIFRDIQPTKTKYK